MEVKMKLGIHSKDWEKVIEAIKDRIPEPYAHEVIVILQEYATNYF